MKFLTIPTTILTVCASLPVTGQTLPAPRARNVGNILTTSSPVTYMGVFLAEIDSSRAKALKLREERGVEVTKVEEDSPAARAEIKAGDVLLEFNGQRVEGIEQFRRFVRETPANREVKVQVSRDGAIQNLTVKVAVRKTGMELAMAPRTIEFPEVRVERPGMLLWSRAALGIEADSIDGQLASYFGVKEGVLVRSVMKGSSAEKAGFRAGDVIVKVDDTKVATATELTRAIRSASKNSNAKKGFPVVVVRDKKEMTLTANPDDDERGQLPGFQMFRAPERPVGYTIRL